MDILDLREKFLGKISLAPSGCIEWTGARRPKGYGLLRVDGVLRSATHVSWFLKHGVWPTAHLLHRCDNPPCVDPDHLFEGTDADNAADRSAKGRGWQKLTGLEVSEIVALTDTRMGLQEIADLFDITPGYVSNLRHGRFRTKLGPKPDKPMKCLTTNVKGEELTLKQIAEKHGVPLQRIRERYSRGVRGDALIRPAHVRR